MASSPPNTVASGEHDEFVHHIAIKLSREMNIINTNDLLARRVIDMASGTLASFKTGMATKLVQL
jgi:pre-mRNA-splicing factor ATP-dependent RNA helicase DHX38/PRP16